MKIEITSAFLSKKLLCNFLWLFSPCLPCALGITNCHLSFSPPSGPRSITNHIWWLQDYAQFHNHRMTLVNQCIHWFHQFLRCVKINRLLFYRNKRMFPWVRAEEGSRKLHALGRHHSMRVSTTVPVSRSLTQHHSTGRNSCQKIGFYL